MKRVMLARNPCRLLIALGFLIACGQMCDVRAQSDKGKNAFKNRKVLIEKALSPDQPSERQRIALILLGEIGIQEVKLIVKQGEGGKSQEGIDTNPGLADPDATVPLGRSLTPLVIKLLQESSDPKIKSEAALTLGKINPVASKAIAALIQLFGDSDPNVRIAAAKGIRDLINSSAQVALANGRRIELGDTLGVTKVLQGEGFETALVPAAVDFARSLTQGPIYGDILSSAGAALPVLGDLVNDRDPEVRYLAQQTLIDCADQLTGLYREQPFTLTEPKGADKTVAQQELTTRWVQISVLERPLSQQIPKIASVLRSSDPNERLRGTQFLKSVATTRLRGRALLKSLEPTPVKGIAQRSDAEEAVPLIQTVSFQAENPDAQLVPEADADSVILPQLLSIIKANPQLATDPDDAVRLSFADMLEHLEASGIPVLELTLKLANDKNQFVRWTAVRTLGRIAPKADTRIVPALGELVVKEKDLGVRMAMLYSLERFGAKAQPAIDSVIAVTKRGDADGRTAAVRTLGQMKAPPEIVVPPLAVALRLKDDDTETYNSVRLEAAKVLNRMGKDARLAVNELTDALQDPDTRVRTFCAQTLLMIGQEVLNEPKEKR